MEHPFVSVIIPNYNHARFLSQRFESILNQTYDNFEIIILDDKSNDNSIDVINRYKDNSKISKIIINEENSGSPFIQWEKGFNYANGELIWIAESDDSCEPNLLELLVKEFENDDKCTLAFCKSIKIDTEGISIGEAGMKKDMHLTGISFFKHYLYRFCYINNASSALFRKSALSNIDWRHSNFRGSGDWLLWIEISRQGNVAYIDQPLNYYRIHGSNTTTIQLHSGKNEAEAIDVYRFMREKAYIGYLKELRTRIAHIYSIKYGKLSTVLNKETKQKLLKGWNNNFFTDIITTTIYSFHLVSGVNIIKR